MGEKLVVIGAGMASGRMLEHLFEADAQKFDVTLFGAEPRGNYNRIQLSPVLAGEKSYDEIVTHDANWYAAHGVTCRFERQSLREPASRSGHAAGTSPKSGESPSLWPVPPLFGPE